MNRIKKFQKRLRDAKMGAALVSKPENVRYLSNFIGTNGELFITPKKAYLITDFRYFRSAKKMLPRQVEIYDYQKGLKKLMGRYKSIGLEQAYLNYLQVQNFKKRLKGIKFKNVSGWVESMRMLKDSSEIKIIKKGVSIANVAFQRFVQTIKVGQSEDEMEWNLTSICRELGGEGFSFPPIICFGKDTADVHHAKSDNKLKKGQQILIDFGIVYQGYATDMTRMIYTQIPTEEQEEIYNIVLEANQRAIGLIEVGKKLSEIDAAARDYIEEKGYGKYFGHSTGHGVGLEIHEQPNVSHHSPEIIQPGMVITIEPGIYTEKHGGVRIEDMVYINEKGTVEVLTRTVPKTLKVIKI